MAKIDLNVIFASNQLNNSAAFVLERAGSQCGNLLLVQYGDHVHSYDVNASTTLDIYLFQYRTYTLIKYAVTTRQPDYVRWQC